MLPISNNEVLLHRAIIDSNDARGNLYSLLLRVIHVTQYTIVDSPISVEENIDKIQRAAALYLETVRVQRCLQTWLDDQSKPTQVIN